MPTIPILLLSVAIVAVLMGAFGVSLGERTPRAIWRDFFGDGKSDENRAESAPTTLKAVVTHSARAKQSASDTAELPVIQRRDSFADLVGHANRTRTDQRIKSSDANDRRASHRAGSNRNRGRR